MSAADSRAPRGAAVVREGDEVRITVRWFQPIVILFFVMILFMAVPPVILMIGGESAGMVGLIPIGLLLYWNVAQVVNRTDIVIGRTLAVRHGPLPWFGQADVPLDRVTGVELHTVVRRRGGGRRMDAVAVAYGDRIRLAPGRTNEVIDWVARTVKQELDARRAAA